MATVTSPAMSQAIPERRTLSRRTRRSLAFYAFISPWLIGFFLLTAGPMLIGFLTSLSNYDGLNLDSVRFVGLRNYERALGDDDAMYALTRSITWAALNVPIWLIASLGLAIALDQAIKARGIFRTLFYLPSIVPIVGMVWVWRGVLNQNSGLLNGIISIFRPGTAIQWLAGDLAIYSLTTISVWAGIGGGMIIFLAGLQNIPTELKEAAKIDGAGGWRVMRHVTLPLLTPVIFFQLILSIIGALQQFALPMVLAGGQMGSVPPRGTYLYMAHVNLQIFMRQRFGYGMALLWILFAGIIALTIILFFTSRYWVYSESEQR